MKIIGIIVILVIGILFFLWRQGIKIHKENLKLIENAKNYNADFSTPEGAILCLEKAYREKDIIKAIKCKDFVTEARLMLKNLEKDNIIDDETLKKTADTLKLSFEKHTESAFPNLDNVKSYLVHKEEYDENVVVVTEIQQNSEGLTTKQKLLVSKTDEGWRVLNPLK